MSVKRCADCRHFTRYRMDPEGKTGEGQCRRRPPFMIHQLASGDRIGTFPWWPLVADHEWCSAYKHKHSFLTRIWTWLFRSTPDFGQQRPGNETSGNPTSIKRPPGGAAETSKAEATRVH